MKTTEELGHRLRREVVQVGEEEEEPAAAGGMWAEVAAAESPPAHPAPGPSARPRCCLL
jgi:hypothetical protein